MNYFDTAVQGLRAASIQWRTDVRRTPHATTAAYSMNISTYL